MILMNMMMVAKSSNSSSNRWPNSKLHLCSSKDNKLSSNSSNSNLTFSEGNGICVLELTV